MTTSPEEKKALWKFRMEKVGHLIDDARFLLEAGRWESAIGRDYGTRPESSSNLLEDTIF